jgi:hypothetical protein
MGQWPREIEKFLGKSKRVVVLKSMMDLNKVTVGELRRADIVVVSFTVLTGDNYFSRLARLAGANANSLARGGKTGGRHFDAVYKECLAGLSKRVSVMKEDCSAVFEGVEDDAYAHATTEGQAKDAIRLDGKKAVYKKFSEEQTKQEIAAEVQVDSSSTTGTPGKPKGKGESRTDGDNDKLKKTDRDPWGLLNQNDLDKMKCPPLEAFFWNRIVVDEFHCEY